MSNTAERDLIAGDPALPGLALLLSPDALRARFGTDRISYLRYKPGETCTAFLGTETGGMILRAVTATRWRDYLARPVWRDAGSGVVFIDDAQVVALPPRFDREIGAAKRLLDPARRPAFLSGLLPAGFGPTDRFTVLKHKPGRRIVARIDRNGTPFALLKAVPSDSFARLLASAQMAEAQSGVHILGLDPARGVVVQAWVDGRTADPRHAAAEDFNKIGAVLAQLHATPISGAPTDAAYKSALAALAHILPECANQAMALSRGLDVGFSGAPTGLALCHGDFSADQVVLTASGPRLIDWDRAGPGDPMADAGSFLARLDADRIAGTLSDARSHMLGQAFLDGYGPHDGQAIALHRAAALAALVCEPFRARSDDWVGQTFALLRQASNLAETCGAIARALDRDRMAGVFAGTDLARLDPPELLRERTGRRALIAYRGTTATGDLIEAYGKLRVKGPDRRTPALHRALRAAGFTGAASVPEVLGEYPDACLWLQARVEGRLLTDLVPGITHHAPFFKTGAALAQLHRTRSDIPLPEWRMTDEAAVMDKSLAQAGVGHPDLRARFARLAARLGTRMAALPPVVATGIHRDFYPDQVMVGPGTIWLLDLDLASRGDPAIDIGNFLAHLREQALRDHGTITAYTAHETAFLDGYASASPLPDQIRCKTLTAVSLARHCWIAQRVPGRANIVEPVLRACENLL